MKVSRRDGIWMDSFGSIRKGLDGDGHERIVRQPTVCPNLGRRGTREWYPSGFCISSIILLASSLVSDLVRIAPLTFRILPSYKTLPVINVAAWLAHTPNLQFIPYPYDLGRLHVHLAYGMETT